MDKPRLRPVEPVAVEGEDGQRYLALRDPTGLSDTVEMLTPVGAAILQLCDGERTRDEICAEFTTRYGAPLKRAALDGLLERLEAALFLDSDAYRARVREVLDGFRSSSVRQAHLAGRSYPGDPRELAELLDAFFEPPHGPGKNGDDGGKLPRAIIAPHIDFQRGGPAYAWAYEPLRATTDKPELVVVFGTDHHGADHPFTLTRKHYLTPLGRLETDVALVDALTGAVRDRLGPTPADNLFADEIHHRTEHSIEFQMVWLAHLWGDATREIKVLPILCGSLHHLVSDGRQPERDTRVSVFIEELRRLTTGRRVLWIAGADLAHVGPHFGDTEPLGEPERETLEDSDHFALAAAARGDAAGWFEAIARTQDRTRVCGLPPIYALLETARPGAGTVKAYGQCPADEEAGSLVSIASVVFDSEP